MPALIDLKGQRFGRLTVLRRAIMPADAGAAHWVCDCDCGNRCVRHSQNLRSGGTKSCGCLRREQSKENARQLWLRIRELERKAGDAVSAKA